MLILALDHSLWRAFIENNMLLIVQLPIAVHFLLLFFVQLLRFSGVNPSGFILANGRFFGVCLLMVLEGYFNTWSAQLECIALDTVSGYTCICR